MTTTQRYQEILEQVKEKITVIYVAVENHAMHQSKEPRNWCYVGDMAYIDRVLSEITEFLNTNKLNGMEWKHPDGTWRKEKPFSSEDVGIHHQ
jgi:hypothetical protein